MAAAVSFGRLEHPQEAIALYDEVVQCFGEAFEPGFAFGDRLTITASIESAFTFRDVVREWSEVSVVAHLGLAQCSLNPAPSGTLSTTSSIR